MILAYARILQREALAGSSQPWLRGKHIGLFSVGGQGEESMLFRRSATELGAKVAQVRPFAAGTLEGIEVQNMARLIDRLYDAVEVFGAPSNLLQQLRSAAGVPIYNGLAAATHSTAGLAELLGTETPHADRRRYVVQAVLLATII